MPMKLTEEKMAAYVARLKLSVARRSLQGSPMRCFPGEMLHIRPHQTLAHGIIPTEKASMNWAA